MNLSQIIVDTKTVTVDFPGLDGFKVRLAAISREMSRKLRKESEVTKLDSKLKMPITELDEEVFLNKFAIAAIKGWQGLKMSYLSQLVLVDESAIEDMGAEVEFNHDNAIQLLKHSPAFDSWVNDCVFNLDTFRVGEKGTNSPVPR